MKTFILILLIILPNGQAMDAQRNHQTLEACVAKGIAFAAQDPKELDAAAIGFSCFTKIVGDPA